ncbi:PhnD/SsuA/transferrin family substrate-binding protein [Funiculus sociatus GB2-A5]|uniref:PhnD/SsuA/transferrin family substrate-binding protein n=1 Tax=Funiculus sociatus GB2-A5 TaxID=2933946 RepID=A0ABV0JM31_9CYAN|nr:MULTISPECIES: PhnD/SsuA/transferrin family substrate-binding protein [unclassified Trichocoleus]MBD1907014.1 PhnD/SsuA/transferrin family substrate-binding protein [Trichocoleus sp. FACHB-832]MBD2063582.1 PhnD/SsuA/transferrin family substrate-binding protein [Trichocoleus sp. FACHB-6]
MKRRNFLSYFLLLIAGCASATSNSNSIYSNLDANVPDTLRFTVTDTQGLQQLQRDYGGLRTALEEVLEKKIEFVPFESYIAAAAALQSDQVDFVFTGPSEYVVMSARTNAVPIIGITRSNYYPVICVSANNKIKSVAQLKGKKIAMWKVGSTSGHLGPTKLLIDGGLNPKSDLEILLLGSKGLPALQKGEVDAWGGSSVKYEKFLKDEGLSESALPVIVKGSFFPNDLFVVSSKLDSSFVKEMGDRMMKNQDKLLQSLSSVEEGKFKGSKLVSANDVDYNQFRQVYKIVGQGSFVQ